MADGPLAGAILELQVGPPAHGGSCVARHEGRAVFVRHALPGEWVRALVTEDRGGSHCFADAVEVLAAAPGRVTPPCPYAGPGGCGGCDWQHASAPTQRELKRDVVVDQFRRIAHLDVDGLLREVEALPGGLLGWRTRAVYAVGRDGRAGLRRHRSHDVVPVERCRTGADGIGDVDALHRAEDTAAQRRGASGVELARGSGPDVAVLAHRPGPGRQARGRRPPDRVELVAGPAALTHEVGGRELRAAASGFWQVHPAAADTFATALLDAVRPQPGETVLDLYAGAGALTSVLADAVGPDGAVVGVETARGAVDDAAANLADRPWAHVRRGRVGLATLAGLGVEPDVIVLDPPRTGAGRDVITALCATGARMIGYVACDPAALARDAAGAVAAGWRLTGLRGFDAFPMTHHVECVAAFEPPRVLEPRARTG